MNESFSFVLVQKMVSSPILLLTKEAHAKAVKVYSLSLSLSLSLSPIQVTLGEQGV